MAGVLVLVLRRWRACLEPRQALLALGALLVVQGFALWLGPLASPLVLLVPPALLLAQGLGTPCGLAWLAAASFLWPMPITALMAVRLLVAAAVGSVAALAAGRQRSRAELLQLAVLLPGAGLLLRWLLLQWGLQGPGAVARVDLVSEALLLGGLLMAGLLLAPLVETFFGLVTRARLMELADLQRPLLRRLSVEAPGTFEHTLMIAGLAEEGARAIRPISIWCARGRSITTWASCTAPNGLSRTRARAPTPTTALTTPSPAPPSCRRMWMRVEAGPPLPAAAPPGRLHPRAPGHLEDGLLPAPCPRTGSGRCRGALPLSGAHAPQPGDGDLDAGRWLRSSPALPAARH